MRGTSRRARMAVVCAVAFGAALGFATSTRAESIFAMNLLGERFDPVDARVAALGGFVQVVDDSLGLLQYNPAMLAWAKRVTFGVAGYVTEDANQSTDLDRTVMSTKFSAFAFAFPLFEQRISASVGYRGRYDPDYDFEVPGETPAGDNYSDIYQRSGGTWAVPFSIAADLGQRAKVGGFFSLEKGTIENRWTIDFDGTNTADSFSDQLRTLTGTAFGAGAVVRPVGNVSLGVAYESEIRYDTEVDETFTNPSADSSYTETTVQPERWTASVTWRAARGFTVFAGGSLCDFTKFEGLQFPTQRLAEERVASLGMEYRFKGSRFPIRASARYEQLPYTLPDGQEITKTAFTIGSGWMFKSHRGKIDAALQFGKVGSVDTNTYEDRQVRFYLSITGSENWATQREGRS